MDRMLVTVFDDESKAYAGKKALVDLDREGSIALYGYAIVRKNADGTTSVKQSDEPFPIGGVSGSALGALIGALGGPAGAAIGATVGLVAGGAADVYNYGVSEDYFYDVEKALKPGKVAVVAEIDEDWTTPIDDRMDAIGGTVLRRSISEVRERLHQEDVTAMKADIAQMKAEHAMAQAQRRVKLSEKIRLLDSKLQAKLQKQKEHRDALDREAKAKADYMKGRATVAASRASV